LHNQRPLFPPYVRHSDVRRNLSAVLQAGIPAYDSPNQLLPNRRSYLNPADEIKPQRLPLIKSDSAKKADYSGGIPAYETIITGYRKELRKSRLLRIPHAGFPGRRGWQAQISIVTQNRPVSLGLHPFWAMIWKKTVPASRNNIVYYSISILVNPSEVLSFLFFILCISLSNTERKASSSSI
jgi:hypothetical protein